MNFIKKSGHLYDVKNQNGFNSALYQYFDYTPKSEVRRMLQNWPKKYPCRINIIDQSFECGRVYVEIMECGLLSRLLFMIK